MGALELRDRMAAVRPETPILFMSGYTDDGVLRSEAKGGALPFIHKPFTAEAIGRKVREVLEQ
jgi:FixJ family two-component response regulator